MVFYPESNSATIMNKLNKKAKALWFDPRNGNTQNAETIDSGQSKPMSPPSGWEDAVLILN
jgi:hypothetical protein